MSGRPTDPATIADLEEVQEHVERRIEDAERAAEQAADKVVEVGQFSECRWCGILHKQAECPLCRVVRLNKLRS